MSGLFGGGGAPRLPNVNNAATKRRAADARRRAAGATSTQSTILTDPNLEKTGVIKAAGKTLLGD